MSQKRSDKPASQAWRAPDVFGAFTQPPDVQKVQMLAKNNFLVGI